MNHISVFFNNRIEIKEEMQFRYLPGMLGDFCLTPVRYLFDGNKVHVWGYMAGTLPKIKLKKH